jgi:hypothetical protein
MRACAISEDSSTSTLCYTPYATVTAHCKAHKQIQCYAANDVAGPSEVMEHHDGKEHIT